VPILLAGRRLKFDYQFSGYPSAVFEADALGLGPLADLGGVQPTRGRAAAAAGWAPGNASDPAGSAQVAGECIAELLGVLGVQVDLVVGAVQSEVLVVRPVRSLVVR
jgi:hypothetical protein